MIIPFFNKDITLHFDLGQGKGEGVFSYTFQKHSFLPYALVIYCPSGWIIQFPLICHYSWLCPSVESYSGYSLHYSNPMFYKRIVYRNRVHNYRPASINVMGNDFAPSVIIKVLSRTCSKCSVKSLLQWQQQHF